jgi:hypothetical protein
MQILFLIVLGGKKIDTKTRYLSKGLASFNEGFAMKTVLNYDRRTDKFELKPVRLPINLYFKDCSATGEGRAERV